MKKFSICIFLLFLSCTNNDREIDKINKDLEETSKIIEQNNRKLDCLNKMLKTDFSKEIDKHCLKSLKCVREYLDNWEIKCEKK